jgi:LysM repeat protein
MVRIKLLFAFFALMVLAAGVFGAAYYWEKIARPNWEMVQEIENISPEKKKKKRPPDLGKREYLAAAELLKDGELMAARDRFYYLMEFYPESAYYRDAKRIVGEINLDLLISKLPIPSKTEYVVKRGDALVSIARRNECTIDYIMRANGRSTHLIYPGDRLTVYPLDFEVVIRLNNETLTVKKDGRFLKEYAILDTQLPPILKPPVETTISEKVAWNEGRPVYFSSKDYMNCTKWIRTKKIGLFIRAYDPAVAAEKEESDGQTASTNYGVMVAKSDLEELFTILRTGSPVSLLD